MDRLFETFVGGGLPTFPGLFGSGIGRGAMLVPRMDMKETDKEIVVEAEVSSCRTRLASFGSAFSYSPC